MDSISISILCGGKSKRFGRDKCTYQDKGKPLYKIVYQRLKNLTDDIFLQSSLGQVDLNPSITVYKDLVQSAGPLGGICSALHHAKYQKVFVTACDMPKIDPTILKFLKEYSNNHIVVPRWESGHYEPLCAIYSKDVIDKIVQMLRQEQYKISLLYDKVKKLAELPVDPLLESGQITKDCFVNINDLANHPSFTG